LWVTVCSCKRLINPITNPNPVSVTNTRDNINAIAHNSEIKAIVTLRIIPTILWCTLLFCLPDRGSLTVRVHRTYVNIYMNLITVDLDQHCFSSIYEIFSLLNTVPYLLTKIIKTLTNERSIIHSYSKSLWMYKSIFCRMQINNFLKIASVSLW
jgi:hypothetical protein